MKFAIYTLGCKVNQYESQALEKELISRGYEPGHFDEVCDLYIVNTCTVTAVSDKKSRNALRRARKLNPDAVIGVCGCYAQVKPEEIQKLDVDVIGGTGDRGTFIDRMEAFHKSHIRSVQVDNAFRRREFEVLEPGGLQERTRAMMKVQDGCVNFCTYCIIPYARGALRSLPIETAVQQALKLRQDGFREVVITGIEISSWGVELKNGLKIQHLIHAVCDAVPELRIRLGSLEPRTIDEEFCAMLKECKNLCPQFHLSLQSGCDATLQRMNRKYDTARYLESCRLLRQSFADCAITTDLIVGFPQETEEEFQQTLEFIQQVGFSAMHIFPYSRREGTPAAKMPGQITLAEKELRGARAAAVEKQMRMSWQSQFIGKQVEVLFEQTNAAGNWTGHTANYILVEAESEEPLHNLLRNVEILSGDENGLKGRLLPA